MGKLRINMKLSKLIHDLKKIEERHNNYDPFYELEAVIPIRGLSGSHSKVKCVSIGFDWNANQLLIWPEKSLNTIDSRLFSKYRENYLRKNSNYANVCLGKTKLAKFKKKEQQFNKQYEAENWLWQQLIEEEKQ